MDEFNRLLNDYEPMIYHLLKKYHVRDPEGEFYQELAICLWQATLDYDNEKMKFSTYVYNKMQFRLIDLFRKDERKRNREEKYKQHVETTEQYKTEDQLPDKALIIQIKQLLTENEWAWFTGYVLKGKTLVEIGKELGVSANAVRHYKRSAAQKLKTKIKKSEK
ncbi:hypothetical protein GCM10012290_17830 [Halolactibacillus alkaliphilus]|uniref:DNA-directed RNA polymerase sigma-70 factor n=1 Tax=Halolactibacillus alkaliphilus TaxID=442899 RepID=A0A511X2H1_9BACI|nr:sigma-70 family RNA polymerase sigma factor [Halolactibacillus alkaliphilus]GEN57138.1 hypothetical protein HAL01_16020 [Halolactibacillus alkaliphilus]GGN72145.1 hypothetical protein GCM10012290_17830 [Halolactibacillus alkaliphilus]SFO88125.1 RNA polymerase sigma factor, sigma-70 family [Halolactibacillus alkaliphilus]